MKVSRDFMYCEKCGEKLRKGSKICYNCGAEKNSVNYSINEDNLPEEYKPISMWGYIGYDIVFMIPIVGWILIFVFAFGKGENVNVRNLARSRICNFSCLWHFIFNNIYIL